MHKQFPGLIPPIPQKKSPARDIPVNVSTDNPAFIMGEGSNKKIILNYSEMHQLISAVQWDGIFDKSLLLENYVIYFDDPNMSMYYAWQIGIGQEDLFWQASGLTLNNCNIVLFGQLPAGKQGFEWRETGGGGKSGR